MVENSVTTDMTRIKGRPCVASFQFLSNKFTVSALMSDYGEGVSDSVWSGLSDTEKFLKQDAMEQKCVRKAGRLMINAEFGQYFGSILRSGIDGGEAGSVLELADSGAHIDANTKGSGKRFIHDACVGICGLSQPKVWYDNFDPDANIDTGLAGQFLLAEQGSYTLTVPALELTEQETFNAISDVFREILNKTRGVGNMIADRVVCEVVDPEDERGRIFEDLMATPTLAAIKKHGFLDVEKLKGKLIMLALKLTVSHCFLGASPELINSLAGTVVAEGGPPFGPIMLEKPRNSHPKPMSTTVAMCVGFITPAVRRPRTEPWRSAPSDRDGASGSPNGTEVTHPTSE